MFASRTKKAIETPAGVVWIHKLSGFDLSAAAKAAERELMKDMSNTSLKFQQELADTFAKPGAKPEDAETAAAIEKVKSNPLNGYDIDTINERGIISFPVKGVEVNADTVRDLEEPVRTDLATEIMRLTKPELFMDEEERAEEAKKD